MFFILNITVKNEKMVIFSYVSWMIKFCCSITPLLVYQNATKVTMIDFVVFYEGLPILIHLRRIQVFGAI